MERIAALLSVVLLLCGCGAETSAPTPVPEIAVQTQEVTTTAPGDIPLHAVDSTCFSKVGYDRETRTLVVVFLETGAGYAYFGVPEHEYTAMCNADSIGGYYNREIKPYYDDYERLW